MVATQSMTMVAIRAPDVEKTGVMTKDFLPECFSIASERGL